MPELDLIQKRYKKIFQLDMAKVWYYQKSLSKNKYEKYETLLNLQSIIHIKKFIRIFFTFFFNYVALKNFVLILLNYWSTKKYI